MTTRSERQILDGELLDWMGESPWCHDEARFEALALRLFAHQFERCAPYRQFAEARGISAGRLGSWREIPAVPTGAFKEMALRCFPPEDTRRIFRTSGTSGQKRGELHLDDLEIYRASSLASLRSLLFPDLPRGEASARIPMRILAPSAGEAPDSSLSQMFEFLLRELGGPGSGIDVVEGRLQTGPLIAALEDAAARGEAIALCGTAFAFVHLLEALEKANIRLALAERSRVMETGGFKGRSREVPRREFYAALGDRLAVPDSRIINQYGMTELGSQFYDSLYVDPDGPRRKLGPPWVRVRIVDPETGRETEPGEAGMIVIHDLANRGSVAAIQTADLGRSIPASRDGAMGFEILGREPGAEARGCSIAADEMLAEDASETQSLENENGSESGKPRFA